MTEIRNYLSNIKGQHDTKNLYDHFSNVLGKMLLDNTDSAYDKFEEYSHDVKFSGYDYKSNTNFDHKSRLRETYGDIQTWADKAFAILEKPSLGTEEEPQEPPGQAGYVPNLVEEMKKFEWAGIDFGDEENLQLQRSLTKLSHSRRPKTLRLWGKILGAEKDYYVAEGDEVQPLGEEEPIPDAEARGTGVNKYTYFVTSGALEEWIELPLITPKHIQQARRIKHILTGNLNAKIITNPFFDGEERHYLKAQIVRISYSTGVVPRGLYKRVGEGEEGAEETRDIELTEVETYKFPTLEESVSLNSWVHINTNILKEGKIAHSEPTEAQEAEEGFDKEKWLAQRKVQDPFEDVLKPLSKDKSAEGYKRAWTVRLYGDPISYDTVAKVPAKINYAVVVLKSNVWPGLNIVVSENSHQSIYVGYGFKAKLEPYFPTFTKNVFADPEDPVEQSEPNPANLPPQIQENPEGENVGNEGGEQAADNE